MHCLHICNDFSLTRVHSQLYKRLDTTEFRQTIFNPVRQETPIGNNAFAFTHPLSKVVYSKPLKSIHRILFRLKIRQLYTDAKKKIDIESITFSHATTLFSDGALAYKLFKTKGIPYVVAVRVTDIDTFFRYRPDLKYLAYKILDNAEKVIFISDSLKYRFLNHPYIIKRKSKIAKKTIVIYNGVDAHWLQNIAPQKTNEPSNLIYVGRFLRRKNVPFLMKSVVQLNKEGFNCKLTIVGNKGPDKEIIDELAALNPSFFTLTGAIHNREELQEQYRKSHIFAMPSASETFGLVYIEALSQGVPVLYCKNEGVDGIFDFKIGEACVTSIESITEGLRTMLSKYASYELDKINFDLFDWGVISKKYLKLYEEISIHN